MLTGLLITKNRNTLLISKLDVFKKYGFPIIILDGSYKINRYLNKVCKHFDGVKYVHMPSTSVFTRLLVGAENCSTDFLLPLNDDDDFFPKCIRKSLFFLDRNKDYVAAQGSFWVPSLTAKRGYDIEEFTPSLCNNDPIKRLITHCKYYSHTLYAVHRKSAFFPSIHNAIKFQNSGCFGELAQSLTVVGTGKVRRFSLPYCLRSPNNPDHLENNFRTNPISWKRKEKDEFNRNLDNFIGILGKLKPFKDFRTRSGEDFIRKLMNHFIASESRYPNQIHKEYKHLIRIYSKFLGADHMMIFEKLLEFEFFRDISKRIENRLRKLRHSKIDEVLFHLGC